MSTETTQTEEQADFDAVMAAAIAGRPVDPAVAARVHARADEVRKSLPKTDIAVALIREFRDR